MKERFLSAEPSMTDSKIDTIPSGGPRLAHFSDMHVFLPKYGLSWRDILSKRVAGWANLRLAGRAWRFRHAGKVLEAFAADLNETRPDHLVFSGDAGCLGSGAEFDLALNRLGGLLQRPGVAVPGNHDHLVQRSVDNREFETRFAPWQQGIRAGEDAIYPFAQRVGGWWIIAVNSSAPTRFPWDAKGRVGAAQLARLDSLLDKLDNSPRLMVTHYPAMLQDGSPEWSSRRLLDLDKLVRTAERGGVRAWLHGHRHNAYHLPPAPGRPFALICAGSVTQTRRWSYGTYDLAQDRIRGERRRYNPESGRFESLLAFEIPLQRAVA